LILEWVNLADLMRIKGVGEEYSDLLEEAGVDTVAELANRKAENLFQKILEINKEKKLVRRPPVMKQVQKWVEQAKKLPRKVEY
jgi:predicted flap endonuclease-1-like 5' DNA nuclease